MFFHYLSNALRHINRARFTTAVNVLCLVMGMTCFGLAYGVVAWFKNADQHYANADRIFFLTEQFKPTGDPGFRAPWPQTNWGLARLVGAELPHLSAVARLRAAGEAPVVVGEDTAAFAPTGYADPQFLEVFNLPFVSGDATRALQAPHSAVVTEELAMRLFGRRDVLGETMLYRNSRRLTITGVVSGFGQPSHFGDGATAWVRFELLVSMDVYEAMVRASGNETGIRQALEGWATNMANVTYLLAPGPDLTSDTLNAQLQSLVARHAPSDEGEFRVTAHRLDGLYPMVGDAFFGSNSAGVSSVALLLMVGGLILLVSCINYANLATAQVATRAREAALRRVVGAGRGEVIRQCLFETGLLALAALVLVFVALIAVLGVVSSLAGVNLQRAVLLAPEMWLALLGVLAVVTLAAGAYPAFVLARVRPQQALRAQDRHGSRLASTLLVGVQFGTASFLLISLLIMQAQNAELQRQRANLSGVPVIGVSTSLRSADIDLDVLRSELLRRGNVEVVAASDSIPGGIASSNHRMLGRSPDASASQLVVITTAVDHDYFDAMRIGVLAGRGFRRDRNDEWDQDAASADDVMNVVINRSLAEEAGWANPDQAVGQLLYSYGGLGESAVSMRVIGVVDAQPLTLTREGRGLTVYTPELARARLPIIRLSRTDPQQGIADLEEVWRELSPGVPLRRVFLDESFARSMRLLPLFNGVVAGLALFAFAISAMGLVGMAMHIAARRTREIGVRKTLGASVARVLALLVTDFARPVVIANVAMWPLAFIVMKAYVSLFSAQANLTPAPFAAGLAITVGIACLSVALQATKAARLKPATVLRYE